MYVFANTFFRNYVIEELCHLAFWLWIGESARIIGAFLGRMVGINSFSYWGISIEVILFAGGLLEAIGWGIFTLL